MDAPIKGRGIPDNPANRFEKIVYEETREDRDPDEEQPDRPKTVFYRDHAQSILAFNDSPDLPFDASINPYRGCEHGCAYCYARPSHEFLGFSAGLDFETRIMVKQDAPDLLRRELARRSWTPQTLSLSGVTDPYQPAERRFRLTRGCLEVLADFRNPVAVVTKNYQVTRDIDLLSTLAGFDAAAVFVSITTLDPVLARRLEPRTSSPERRLEAIAALSAAGIPAGVMTAPVIPGLNDHEIPAILEAAASAGACTAGKVFLRLPYGVKDLFEAWLRRHEPLQAEKILRRIRSARGGKLNDSRFGDRMRGGGLWADQVDQTFKVACRKYGLNNTKLKLSTDSFRRVEKDQLEMFD